MDKFSLKSAGDIKAMTEGGKRLAWVRDNLAEAVKPGIKTIELEKMAVKLIRQVGGKASFSMVPGYKHATCINVNDEVVHAIPGERVIKPGDIVGIDVGLFYEGFHTDTAVTVAAEPTSTKIKKFLEVGRAGLKKAIGQAKPGNRVSDISAAMEKAILGAGYSPVKALTGHGVGKNLHEEPAIPCFVVEEYNHSPKLVPGMVVAIEIMYNAGGDEVMYKNSDGWTITTADGTISGLFEETVAVTERGPVVLTKSDSR